MWKKPVPTTDLGFSCGSAAKESACNAGDLGLITGLGRSPGEGKGYPFQYSGLENSMDCIVHRVTKSRTQLSDFDSLTTDLLNNLSQKNHFTSVNLDFLIYNMGEITLVLF